MNNILQDYLPKDVINFIILPYITISATRVRHNFMNTMKSLHKEIERRRKLMNILYQKQFRFCDIEHFREYIGYSSIKSIQKRIDVFPKLSPS